MNKEFKSNLLPLKQLAFTLAETLIVMGIIGVVAALTLPNLNSSTSEKEKVAIYIKTYSELNDAMSRAVAVYGPPTEWIKSSDNTDALKSKRIADRITEFMKITKSCETGTGCFTSGSAKRLDGSYHSNIDSNTTMYKYILASGVSLRVRGSDEDIGIAIDVDGKNKGSFTVGDDLFGFSVNMTTFDIYPYAGEKIIKNIAQLKTYCFKNGSCGMWILKNGNMDYLKADRNGLCPDGKTQLSWETISCK